MTLDLVLMLPTLFSSSKSPLSHKTHKSFNFHQHGRPLANGASTHRSSAIITRNHGASNSDSEHRLHLSACCLPLSHNRGRHETNIQFLRPCERDPGPNLQIPAHRPHRLLPPRPRGYNTRGGRLSAPYQKMPKTLH